LPPSSHALNQELETLRQALQVAHRARLEDPTVKDPIEPLVLRVNAGDCIKVHLANRLPQLPAGQHP
ncbi:MAG: hypothetical protein KC643_14690, partial [Nitrospira sp.]|nr:hypothetical protein [Nitrospira sp.]